MMTTARLLLLILIVMLYTGLNPLSASEENKGAENMVLTGGQRGNVSFPHARHQTVLKDCNFCHHLFPQKKGSIQALIGEGKMKKRAVMLECQGCHRKMKKTLLKAGPISCSGCHDQSMKK